MQSSRQFSVADKPPLTEDEQRDLELRVWLEDFVRSEEFAAHFNRRRMDRGTNYNVRDFEKDESMEMMVAMTSNTTWHLYEDVQHALIRKEIRNTRRNQLKGIKIVRDKIKQCKTWFLRNRELRHQLWIEERLDILNYIKVKFNLIIDDYENRPELIDKILRQQKHANEMRKRGIRNRRAILLKLLREMKHEQKQRAAPPGSKWRPTPVRIISDMEVVGVAMTLHELRTPSMEKASDPRTVELAALKARRRRHKRKDGRSSRHSISSGRGSTASSKASRLSHLSKISRISRRSSRLSRMSRRSSRASRGSRSSRRSMRRRWSARRRRDSKRSTSSQDRRHHHLHARSWSTHRGTPRHLNFVVPVPRSNNIRAKFKPTKFFDNLNNLVYEFDRLSSYIQDREEYELEKFLERNSIYSHDRDIVVNPALVEFRDFVCGKSYRQRLRMINKGDGPKKVRYERVIWNAEINDELLMEVEPIGVQKIIPGMSITIQLRFNPETLIRTTEATLIFLSYYPGLDTYKQVKVGIKCTPFCADVRIAPTIISFKEMPIWRARVLKQQRKNYKYITIKNTGLKDCRIVVTRLFTPITLEQAWRNIISILSIDHVTKSIRSTETNDYEKAVEFPRNLLKECVDNVFNTFRFERNIFNLRGNSEERLKVWFKNMECEGYSVETYTFSVYERFSDKKLYCIGTQDVIVNAETTGHFLRLVPNIIDFDMCVFDSVYQTHFEIVNQASVTHVVHIRFPHIMQPYMDATMRHLIIHPEQEIRIGVKFMPREDIIENNKFFDPETSLFEFPIYITVKTKNYEDTPPLELSVFAGVTEAEAMHIKPSDMSLVSILHGEYLFDVGLCSTMETVYYDFELMNKSLTPQHYAFVDLPKYVQIQPNFGFGHLLPMESIRLRVYISFNDSDLESFYDGRKLFHNFMTFLKCVTVKKSGRIKQRLNLKRVLKKLKRLEAMVSNPSLRNTYLIADIEHLRKLILIEGGSDYDVASSQLFSYPHLAVHSSPFSVLKDSAVEVIEPESSTKSMAPFGDDSQHQGEEEEDGIIRHPRELSKRANGFWLQAQLQDVLCDFSHQFVNFPHTPCGSYSMVHVFLRTRKFIRLQNKRHVNSPYRARFQIFGDSKEIQVEPPIGEIDSPHSAKVYLIARPSIPRRLIEERLRAAQRFELLMGGVNVSGQRRLSQSYKKKRKDGSTSTFVLCERSSSEEKTTDDRRSIKSAGRRSIKSAKSTKSVKSAKSTRSAKSSKSVRSRKSGRSIKRLKKPSDNDVVFNYLDYYPTEMMLWRNLQPYMLEANFRCVISFLNKHLKPYFETIFLKAKCEVIPPDFIHNLDTQELNFGPVAIGMHSTKTIRLQNIQRYNISPKISHASPLGGFFVPELFQVDLPSEYYLHVPITFKPDKSGEQMELIELTSNSTIYPFILKGRGVEVKLRFVPDFGVSRLEAPRTSNAEMIFDIWNDCDAKVKVSVEKLCELQGTVQNLEDFLDPKAPMPSNDSKSTSSQKSLRDARAKQSTSKVSQRKSKENQLAGRSKSLSKTMVKRSASRLGGIVSKTLLAGEQHLLHAGKFSRNDTHMMFSTNGSSVVPVVLEIPAHSRRSVRVTFGGEKRLSKSFQDKWKWEQQQHQRRSGGSSQKKSLSLSIRPRSIPDNKLFVAKYNIILGSSTFVKDIIIFGRYK